MNGRPSLLNVLEVETRSSSGILSVTIIGINIKSRLILIVCFV